MPYIFSLSFSLFLSHSLSLSFPLFCLSYYWYFSWCFLFLQYNSINVHLQLYKRNAVRSNDSGRLLFFFASFFPLLFQTNFQIFSTDILTHFKWEESAKWEGGKIFAFLCNNSRSKSIKNTFALDVDEFSLMDSNALSTFSIVR